MNYEFKSYDLDMYDLSWINEDFKCGYQVETYVRFEGTHTERRMEE